MLFRSILISIRKATGHRHTFAPHITAHHSTRVKEKKTERLRRRLRTASATASWSRRAALMLAGRRLSSS